MGNRLHTVKQILEADMYGIRDLKVKIITTVVSGRLPVGNVLIFPQTVVGAGYRKVWVM